MSEAETMLGMGILSALREVARIAAGAPSSYYLRVALSLVPWALSFVALQWYRRSRYDAVHHFVEEFTLGAAANGEVEEVLANFMDRQDHEKRSDWRQVQRAIGAFFGAVMCAVCMLLPFWVLWGTGHAVHALRDTFSGYAIYLPVEDKTISAICSVLSIAVGLVLARYSGFRLILSCCDDVVEHEATTDTSAVLNANLLEGAQATADGTLVLTRATVMLAVNPPPAAPLRLQAPLLHAPVAALGSPRVAVAPAIAAARGDETPTRLLAME